jgi:hypothetical protein
MGALIPMRMTVLDRTYEVISPIPDGEFRLSSHAAALAEEMGANVGEDDFEFFLKNLSHIPYEFRGKIFVFTQYVLPNNPHNGVVATFECRKRGRLDPGYWVDHWASLSMGWASYYCFLRRLNLNGHS